MTSFWSFLACVAASLGDLKNLTDVPYSLQLLSASAEDGQKAESASFSIFTKTIYDALGRVKLVANPYRSQPASTDGWTRSTYDLAGRVIEIATFAGGVSTPPPDAGTNSNWMGSVVTTYSGEQTTVRDQANKQRRGTTDALGHLKSVDEMSEYPSTSVYATTSYDYDARGNLGRLTKASKHARSSTTTMAPQRSQRFGGPRAWRR